MIKSNTCIAVLRTKKGKLMFAADRRISLGAHEAQVSPRSKITKRNDMIFAGTGSAYICELVCDIVTLPEPPKSMSAFEFMHNIVVDSVQNLLIEKRLCNPETNKLLYESTSALIVVAVQGHLFELTIDKDIGVDLVEIDAPYATGCGGAYALGSLLTTKQMKTVSDVDKLTVALQVAAQISPGCDDNINIVSED